jgi:hypothetical protein
MIEVIVGELLSQRHVIRSHEHLMIPLLNLDGRLELGPMSIPVTVRANCFVAFYKFLGLQAGSRSSTNISLRPRLRERFKMLIRILITF